MASNYDGEIMVSASHKTLKVKKKKKRKKRKKKKKKFHWSALSFSLKFVTSLMMFFLVKHEFCGWTQAMLLFDLCAWRQ
jgi:hypothetical protein